MGEEKLEELCQFGDMAEVMVLQCDEILQILRLIVVDHHEDGDL